MVCKETHESISDPGAAQTAAEMVDKRTNKKILQNTFELWYFISFHLMPRYALNYGI